MIRPDEGRWIGREAKGEGLRKEQSIFCLQITVC